MEFSPADVVRWLLIQLNVGVYLQNTANWVPGSWPIFATNEPNVPDQCITVIDTVGQLDGREMIGGTLYDHFGFQVRVRTNDHRTGWTKAASIRTAMATQVNRNTVDIPDPVGTQSGIFCVYNIAKIGQVLTLGKEVPKTKRSLFTINALVALHASVY